MSRFRATLASVAIFLTAACASLPQYSGKSHPPARRPNMLVILADDLGYSDISPYGGEIATPNLDRLARMGARLTHFHSAPACSPTRAMLLSGADTHAAGLGAMAEFIPPQHRGQEGFEGVLSRRVATLAERFSQAGYRTAMAGKWHLGMADGQRPAQRGFQKSFALLQGASNHFGHGGFGGEGNGIAGATYVEDDRRYEPGPDFYSSNIFTDKILQQLQHGPADKPFFAYLAFSAPHSPLQARAEDIARYSQIYTRGWAWLAQERLKNMRLAGVLPGKLPYSTESFGPNQQSWDALSPQDKAREARRMAVYAAMVDRLDYNVGRVLNALERSGQLDNTIILFMSDNGPAAEYEQAYKTMPGFEDVYKRSNHSIEAMGSSQSFVLQDPHWASAIAAPSRLFKGFVTEGGTLVPLIVHAPGVPEGKVNAVIGDMRDIAPTLLALAGLPEEDKLNGMKVAMIEGEDLMPWLSSGKDDRPIEHVALSFYGQASVRAGAWKAVRLPPPSGDNQWHLYNIVEDPAESVDRKAAEPELFASLLASWQEYAKRHGLDHSE